MDFDNDYWNAMDKDPKDTYSVKASEFGISRGAGDVTQNLRASIFAGASQVELGFVGREKGSRYQVTGHTPESYGRDEREAMRQLSKINDVKVSTHSTVSVSNLSGLGEGGFSDEAREKSLMEVKRATEFAAETAGGGPVVIHTGEFPRSIQEKFGKEGFRFYPGEEERKVYPLVNEKTGRVSHVVREDEVIWEPKMEKDDQGNIVPKTDEQGNILVEEVKFKDFKEEFIKKNPDKKADEVAQRFLEKLREHEKDRVIGQAHEYENYYMQAKKAKDEILKHMDFYKDAKGKVLKISEDKYVEPIPYFKDQLKDVEKKMNYGQEIAIAARREAKRIEREIEETVPIEEYGIKKSAETMARAAVYAYDRERSQRLKRPLFIAPENVFPEMGYGSHPQELKNLILESRKAMVDQLKRERHIPENEAERIAKDHIKATFDIGHAYTWKKFFDAKPGESLKSTEKRFKRWLLDQAKDLAKEGIIGHVHISDNFGYYDEHLTPGEGEVPLKEFIKEIKEQGFKGQMIVEPGGQPEGREFEALKGAWRTFASPMYRIDTASQTWTDVQDSYFGRTGSPTYLVGDTAPSKDWSLFSETQLE